jgi:hypothetical protein
MIGAELHVRSAAPEPRAVQRRAECKHQLALRLQIT